MGEPEFYLIPIAIALSAITVVMRNEKLAGAIEIVAVLAMAAAYSLVIGHMWAGWIIIAAAYIIPPLITSRFVSYGPRIEGFALRRTHDQHLGSVYELTLHADDGNHIHHVYEHAGAVEVGIRDAHKAKLISRKDRDKLLAHLSTLSSETSGL